MVGTVKEQIYIKAIPKGTTLKITALNLLPPDPPKECKSLGARLEILWELSGTPAGSNARGAFLVETSPDTVDHPGPAPAVSGADEVAPTVDPNDENSWATKLNDLPPVPATTDARAAAGGPFATGRFIVETTEWGLVERPDYASVVYQVNNQTPLRVVSAISGTILGMPKDAIFVIGANPTTQEVGIDGTQDKAVASTLVEYLVKGIF
ncbi:hypothetical protein EST38_g1609 [Candolleomyces aberdarensis]|uniref:Uncharacterized protein n=1 Tax=Candolleomyces aberdarensis TaxID=2316362 RepID=A0A4Q2DX21_9AGAR|nr:hypothetical protein EST38_g1609 [Candolleomyces aberdarensis]